MAHFWSIIAKLIGVTTVSLLGALLAPILLLFTLQEVLLAPLRLLLDDGEAGNVPPGPDLLPAGGHLWGRLSLLAALSLSWEVLLSQQSLEVVEWSLLGDTHTSRRSLKINILVTRNTTLPGVTPPAQLWRLELTDFSSFSSFLTFSSFSSFSSSSDWEVVGEEADSSLLVLSSPSLLLCDSSGLRLL